MKVVLVPRHIEREPDLVDREESASTRECELWRSSMSECCCGMFDR
jgi:hypothetical protein